MYTIQVMHNKNLRISLSAITRFGALGRFANFYYNKVPTQKVSILTALKRMHNSRYDVTFKLVQARIDFTIVELRRTLTNRLE